MVSKIAVSAFAVICLSAGAAAPADRQPAAPWWNTAWKYRLKVSVEVNYNQSEQGQWRAFDGPTPPPLTATAEVHRANPASVSAQKDVRVVDTRGNVVPCKVYYIGKPNTVTVRFPVPRSGGDYYIYYGSEDLDPPDTGEWLPATRSLKLAGLETAAQIPVKTMDDVKTALRGNLSFHGATSLNVIASHRNPLRLQSGNHRYLTSFEGFLNCEMSGEYQFAVDSGGPGFLLINDVNVAANPGTHRPCNQWLNPGDVVLKKGYHHFRLIVSEMNAYQGVRLGWRPPWKKAFEVVPTDAFAKFIRARPKEFSSVDGREAVYFTFNESMTVIKLVRKTVVPVELINLSSFSDSRGKVTYMWKVDGREFTGRQTTEALEIGRSHRIRLEAYREGRCVGSLERTCRPYASTMADAGFALEVIGAPNIVFVGEQESLSFRIRSPVARAMAFYWQYVVRKPGGGAILDERTGRLDATASEEAALSIPLDTDFCDRDAEVEVALTVTGDRLASSTFHVMPIGPRIQHLKPTAGCLVNGDGTRVIISTHLIDEAAFRKWAPVRYVKNLLTSSNTSILLYGSAMENTTCGREKFISYISCLRARYSEAGKGFDYVKRSDSITGILADVARFAAVLGDREPDTVIISPGPSDVMRGVPVRDFKRSVQLMLDLIRAKNSAVRMVLVSPPPLATNLKLSKLYRDGMEEIADRNRISFVDIHSLLDGEDHLHHFKSERDDGVYYTYPNNEAQQTIAEAIWQHLE